MTPTRTTTKPVMASVGAATAATAATTVVSKEEEAMAVKIGPDLNASRSPLDRKLYRQILLPNGLRAVLISDTLALQQQHNHRNFNGGRNYHHVDDDSSSEEDEHADEVINRDVDVDSDNGSVDDDESKGNNDGLRDAAVSIVVGAGSAYDPMECQGLAHFLEHLLFMGSEKYPEENDYEGFVAKHGGSDNAWTEWEYTTYSLSIPQAYLWPALDRLAQFFIAPLLLESAVDRELLSIESEFQLHVQSDSCRRSQLLCSTFHKDHCMNKFSWGNLQSIRETPERLGVDKMHLLRQFYDQYYYAANMRMVVMGGYPLDVMQERVLEIFAKVPSLPRASLSLSFSLPVDPERIFSWDGRYESPVVASGLPWPEPRPLVYRIVPVKERHALTMTWQLPSQLHLWASKPTDYIAHLMGHEGQGSLLSYFRSQSWATSCSVGLGDEGDENASSHGLFTASFSLSEEGVREWPKLVAAAFEYVGMLHMYRINGWPEWIFKELQTINELSHRYGDELSPDECVDAIAEDMVPHYPLPPERLLDGSHLLFDFDAAAVANVLEQLVPSSVRIDLMSSSFVLNASADVDKPTNSDEAVAAENMVLPAVENFAVASLALPQVEPMFGTCFWCHEIGADMVEDWTKAISPHEPTIPIGLPPQNPFIPECCDLKPLPDDDALHPLLNSSLKLCLPVGKSKQWFAGTAVKFNNKNNSLLISFEDEEENWYKLDRNMSELNNENLAPNFEGTMEKRSIKFRICSLSRPGEGPVRKYGDESDFHVVEGKGFPPIPPALAASRLPKQVADTNLLKLWHLQDRTFLRPTAELRLEVICAEANKTPLHRACAELLVALCADACMEQSYLASVCELDSSIEASDVGFYMRFHGFNDKLMQLFDLTMSTFISFRGLGDTLPACTCSKRFDACLEVMTRRYKNAGMGASDLSSDMRLQALRPTLWSVHKKAQAIADLSIEKFAQTVSLILNRFAIEGLYHGNVDRKDARAAVEHIVDLVGSSGSGGLARKNYPPQSVLRIPSVISPEVVRIPSKNTAEPNTAVELYVQVGKDNLRERVLIELLTHMMYEVMYAQIRTLDQYGYDVHCDIRWSYGIIGFIFKVVTNVKSADTVVERIDRFLIEYRKELADMASEVFTEHAVGLASQKLDRFNSLSDETSSYWGEIRDGRYEWQAWRDETICLRSFTKKDALDAFDKWLIPGTKRKALAVQVIGCGDGDASNGRPVIEEDNVSSYLDEQVAQFHAACKRQTWGRVNARLF